MDPIRISTTLRAPIDTIWHEVGRPALLQYVARGRLTFHPVDPPEFPERWAEGSFRVALRGFGVIPLGWQEIGISFPEVPAPGRSVRDLGRSPLFKVWDHTIILKPEGETATRYTDEIRFETWLPMMLARPIVSDFYRHRQRRWARLVANGFDYSR